MIVESWTESIVISNLELSVNKLTENSVISILESSYWFNSISNKVNVLLKY